MKVLKSLFLKYKELILYVFFGGLTTLVNWAGYWLLADVFHVPYLWATAIAQVLSILFAYVTNRIWGLHVNDMVMKLLSNVIVVIVNYVFSKLIVFRKPKQGR